MSVHSLKRSLLFSFLAVLAANGAFAVAPSARYETRMVWDPVIHRAVLFGGLTAVDAGTRLAYELGDTWQWTGSRWIETFPAHSPTTRAGHLMIFDSARNRIVIFGGRHGKTNLNDTWSYDGNDWTQLFPPASPSVRELTSQAYDSARDRIVMFGGYLQTYSGTLGNTLTETPLHDTWEFDGTTWKQILSDGPNVIRPTLEYDPVRNQTIMIAAEPTKSTTVMYAWDPANAKWNQLAPALLPACALGGEMTWQSSDNTILYTGAVCTDSAATEDTYEWDGTNWTKIALTIFAGRYFGSALTFDPDHQVAVLFGGANAAGILLGSTFTYANTIWLPVADSAFPVPRSLFAFTADPARSVIDLYGGLNESTNLFDYWTYQNGVFRLRSGTTGQPTDCSAPLTVFDTDRQKLVMVCNSSATLDFDGTTWTSYDVSKSAPPQHSFAALAYDQTLKKTVFFGGYDGVSAYLNQTWTFDGTAWSQVKKNPAPFRSLTMMWWDPTLKKTVLYGGLGRLTANDRLTRFSDMWSFDGTGWLEIKPATTPGMRYGGSVLVDPKSGHAFLFGGIRVDTDANNIQVQVYANDMWEWDGTTWTKVTSSILTPPARENAGFAVDPYLNQFVLFGGYAGTYLSDIWIFSNGQWRQSTEVLNRRRASH